MEKEKNEEKKKFKLFSTKNKIALAVMILLIIGLTGNMYASTHGYGNIFFMIKTIFSGEEITGKDNLLSDREITISYSSIEIADGLKVQIQKMVLENNKSTLYVNVNDENTTSTRLPLNYKLYDESNKMIAETRGTQESYHTDEIIANQKIAEDATLKLEILDKAGNKLAEITIDLANKELLLNGEAVFSKISEVELRKYLAAFAPVCETIGDSEELTAENEGAMVLSIAMNINSNILQKDVTNHMDRQTFNNMVDSFYNKTVQKDAHDAIITSDLFKYDADADAYIYGGTQPEYQCIDLSDISYKDSTYKMNFVYIVVPKYPVDKETLPQYEATIELKVNPNAQYSKYKIVSITEGKSVENSKNAYNDKELVYDTNYSKKFTDEFGVHTYNVPYINIDSLYVKELNNKIEKKYKPEIESIQIGNVEPGKIEYQYYINGNVLSIIIISYYSGDCTYHEVYNIDINKGTGISNEDLLKIKNIDSEEYLGRLNELYKAKFISIYGEKEKWLKTQDQMPGRLEIYEDCMNRTISSDNYSISTPIYLDENGTINIVATIHSMAGAGSYEHIIKYESLSNTENSQEETIKAAYFKYIEEGMNVEELSEWRVDNVEIATGNEYAELRQMFIDDGSYKEGDVFAYVTYSVRPKDINNTRWIAGNGHIEGNWIVGKMACVRYRAGKIIGSGTGW